jgi:protein-S-isoprenylcysteine O-methyltransferase
MYTADLPLVLRVHRWILSQHPYLRTAANAGIVGAAAASCVAALLVANLVLLPAAAHNGASGATAGRAADCAASYELLQTGAVYALTTFVLFHTAEFIIAVLFRPHDATPESFLILHSPAFLVANTVAWVELILRRRDAIFGGTFSSCLAGSIGGPSGGDSVLGVSSGSAPSVTTTIVWSLFFGCLTAGLYGVRAWAMVHAGASFSFQVEQQRMPQQVLVTTGPYAKLRHPSYFAWFWFIVASQMLAGNWFCLLVFPIVMHRFFAERIAEEEALLLGEDFFGTSYAAFKAKTVVGIPFIQ